MSDLISRQQAVDALADMHCKSDEDGYVWIIRSDAWARIDALPSAQQEQRWIPCSERLPEKDGRYQVTRYDYVTNTEFIDILWYEKNTWWNRQATGDYAVTAWMPLPEPWRGDSICK